MVRALFVFVLLFQLSAHAQDSRTGLVIPYDDFSYRSSGLFSASATFAPGVMLNRDRTNFHLNAFGEYHFNRTVSVKSDSYLYLNSPSEALPELKMIRSHFGVFYHFNQSPFGNWDVKLGLMPGVTFAKNPQYLEGKEILIRTFAPSFAVALGYDYYVWKYFHFFTQIEYANATLRGLPNGSERWDELLFSAGLGFQIPTRR